MTIGNPGGDILTALYDRMVGIKTSLGWDIDVRAVRLDYSLPTENESAMDLPAIEIINKEEDYDHGASATYKTCMYVTLLLVAEKSWTDVQMEQFKSNVRKAIFGGAPDASGNTGVTLGGKCQSIRLLKSDADLNMVSANRLYVLNLAIDYIWTTWR